MVNWNGGTRQMMFCACVRSTNSMMIGRGRLLCARMRVLTRSKPQYLVPRRLREELSEKNCVSVTIEMALEGSSKNFPICVSDSSPVSVPASPVKPLTEESKRDQCRYDYMEQDHLCLKKYD